MHSSIFYPADVFFLLIVGITTDMSVWDGVVVSPLDKAYEKPLEKKEGEEDDMEAEGGGDEAMEMADNWSAVFV